MVHHRASESASDANGDLRNPRIFCAGAEAPFLLGSQSARLKSCPDSDNRSFRNSSLTPPTPLTANSAPSVYTAPMPRLLFFAILLTLPAHAQWEMQNSTTTADLRGIHSIGNGVAWASGTNGTVLRTEDGGYLWQSCSMPPGAEHLDFRGIQAFDANTAIVMSCGKGDLSRLYKTTDGCHSWKLVFTNPDPDGFWDAIAFKDELHGYLLGDPVEGRFVLLHTSNGGTYWPNRNHDSAWNSAYATEGAFAASNSCLLAPDQYTKGPQISFATGGIGGSRVVSLLRVGSGDVYSSNWESASVPLAKGTPSSGIFSLALADTQRLVAVGGDYTKPDDALRQRPPSHSTAAKHGNPPKPRLTATAPPSPTTKKPKPGSPSAPTAPTSPPTTAGTGAPSIPTPPSTNRPTPTTTGTPSRSPSSSAPTAASASSSPPPSHPTPTDPGPHNGPNSIRRGAPASGRLPARGVAQPPPPPPRAWGHPLNTPGPEPPRCQAPPVSFSPQLPHSMDKINFQNLHSISPARGQWKQD